MLKVFDWRKSDTPRNIDIWFNDELVPDSAHVFLALMSDEPDVYMVDGLIGCYALDWSGCPVLATDEQGNKLDHVASYYRRGRLLWQWRPEPDESEAP